MKRKTADLWARMGGKAPFAAVRQVWSAATKKYQPTYSTDGKKWKPGMPEGYNISTVRFVGGPEDGRVSW